MLPSTKKFMSSVEKIPHQSMIDLLNTIDNKSIDNASYTLNELVSWFKYNYESIHTDRYINLSFEYKVAYSLMSFASICEEKSIRSTIVQQTIDKLMMMYDKYHLDHYYTVVLKDEGYPEEEYIHKLNRLRIV